MILKLRQRMAQDESGFTLVELLVVMLILGILAAIAIPAFFNQSNKAKDADAKTAARTAETAMETYNTGNNGSYQNATAGTATSELNKIEPTLNDVGTRLSIVGTPSQNTYTLQVQSSAPSGNYFRVSRAADGTTSLTCGTTNGATLAGSGQDGCPTGSGGSSTPGNWGD